jgi:hypothetical protein
LSRPLQKRRSLLEHQAVWLILSVLASLVSAGIVIAIDRGALAEYAVFPAIARGYTLTGLFFGVASVSLALLTFLYSLRKRSLQEKMPLGTMAGWLWGHVYLGLMCLVLAVAHAGYGTIGLELTLGKTVLLLLLLLVVTGLIWRVVYAVVPAKAANEVGNYSQAASRTRAATALVEIEKLSAGRSPALQQMVEWLLRTQAGDAEVAHVARTVPAEDQSVIPDLVRLCRSRHQMLEREARQGSYRRKLQGLRLLHVPVSLLFLLLLPAHVLWALDVPPQLAAGGQALGSTLGAYHGSEECSSCHERIVTEWRSSMHAHALTSPIMVAQNNLALRETLVNTTSPDPRNVCVNCHGPIATALAGAPELPFSPQGAFADAALVTEGIGCSTCHQWQGESVTAGGGLTAFQKGLQPGHTFFGPYDDAVGNAFHKSEATPLFREPAQLCRNCHSVQYDRNGDGKIERGTDLVLQTLFDEWEDFSKKGGPGCVDCHMPVVKGSRAAESALIPLEQDGEAPARVLRSHRFVAVDYPLDSPAIRDESHAEREALLQRAGLLSVVEPSINVTDTRVSFDVSLQNTGTGHNLPGGFAFVRQMWLEVTLLNAQGQAVASSGHLAQPSDDLCDASVVDDPNNPVRPFVVGCSSSDRQLVNLQQQLFDKIELLRDGSGVVQLDSRGQAKLRAAPGAKEAVVQYLTAGPVPRVRPSTGKPTPPLFVGEQRSFPYSFDVPSAAGAARLRVRLLFRAVPPYFLRALAKTQTAADGQNLASLVQNLEINEMARVETALQHRN